MLSFMPAALHRLTERPALAGLDDAAAELCSGETQVTFGCV
jgi:hypothetical protein